MSSVRSHLSFVLCAIAALTVFGCDSQPAEDGPSGSPSGSAVLNLQSNDVTIDEVMWEITRDETEPMSGTIDTSAPGATASVEVFGLLPGGGYTVTMTATSTDGETTCKGEADFSVFVDQATAVMVTLRCQRPPRFGGGRFFGEFGFCAELTKAVVSPLRTSVGSTIDVSAEAFDEEDDAIRYRWRATRGSFEDEGASSTTYTCDFSGRQRITITVSDDDFNHCNSSWTVSVACGEPGDKLQVLHSSDNESSFQDPNTLEDKILNYAALVDGLQTLAVQEDMPSVHLTVGDHVIPGPFYLAAAEVEELGEPGLGDIAMYNAMSVQGNGMGNHEFDGGINDFAHMLAAASYPFLAVNLDFSNVQLENDTPEIEIGVDGSACEDNAAKVLKSCVLEVGDQRIGLIGRAPADFFNVIEDPDTTNPGLDFFGGRDDDNQPLVSAVVQVLEQVDLLEARGINKIFLLDHAQDFTGDPLSANILRGVDVIVAAGSTGFMARPQANGPFNLLRPEDTPSADYPTLRQDMDGKTVLVINSEQLYRYIGNLIIQWDQEGNIFDVDDRSGPVATTAEAVSALAGVIGETPEAPQAVQDVLTSLQNTALVQDAFTEVGTTNFPLNGQRAAVRSVETNLGRVAADSTLWFARRDFPDLGVDVALKNGGGIRDSITGPVIIRLSIQAALAFNNRLTIIRLTTGQLIAAMENSVSRVPALDGRFPQLAGMTLEYDASRPGLQAEVSVTQPSRVRRLVVTRSDGSTDVVVDGFVAQGDLSRTFVLATNSFQATGGDGYAAFPAGEQLAITQIGEQLLLEAYIQDSEGLGGVIDVADPPENPRVVPVTP